MRCHYCNTQLGKPYYHGMPAPVLLRCVACPTEVEYRFGNEPKPYQTTFSCIHHTKTYTACIEPDMPIKFTVYRVEGNLWFPVFKTQTIPNITPTNFPEKIKTILVFL